MESSGQLIPVLPAPHLNPFWHSIWKHLSLEPCLFCSTQYTQYLAWCWHTHRLSVNMLICTEGRGGKGRGGKGSGNYSKTHSKRQSRGLENKLNAKTHSRYITRLAKHCVLEGHYFLPGVQKPLLLQVPSHKGYQYWAEQRDIGSIHFLLGSSSCSG